MSAQPENLPIYLFGLFRWAGTTPEEFRDHYLNKHVEIGKRIPGVAWYYTFLNREPQTGQEGAPRPDAFAVLCFESEEALREAPNSSAWADAMKDNIGFVSHFDTYSVHRVTLIPEQK